MKKLLVIAVVLIGMVMTGNTSGDTPEAKNYVTNGGFEDGLSDKGISGFKFYGKPSLSSDAYKGKNALSMTCQPGGQHLLGIYFDLPELVGKDIEFSFYAKKATPEPRLGMMLLLWNGKKYVTTANTFRDKKVSSDKYTCFKTMRPNLSKESQGKFIIRIHNNATRGVVLLDNIALSLYEKDRDTKAKPEEQVLFSLKKKPPLLDGKLDDEVWQGLQKAVGFMEREEVKAAPVQTEVMSTYDDKNLYLAAKVYEPAMAGIKGDANRPWSGDALEFFISPTKSKPYTQIVIDCDGNSFTLRHTETGKRSCQSLLRAKTHKAEDYWSMEVAIPFSDFNTEMPKDNQRWAFNVVRDRTPGQYSTWSKVNGWLDWDNLANLAFYSRWKIEANMSYWDNNDRDPLMVKSLVSGLESAKGRAKGAKPNLWENRPGDADRGKPRGKQYWGQRGLSDEFQKTHPEFYVAAMRLNKLIVDKSYLDEHLRLLKRSLFYAEDVKPKDTLAECGDTIKQYETDSGEIDKLFNDAYQHYGAAFSDKWSVEKLSGIEARLDALSSKIKALNAGVSGSASALAAQTRSVASWKSEDLKYKPGQKVLNSEGVNERLYFTWKRFNKSNYKAFLPLVSSFDAIDMCYWMVRPDNGNTAETPEDWTWDFVNRVITDRKKTDIPGITMITPLSVTLDGHVPATKEFHRQIEKDPDIISTSYDGLLGNHRPKGKAIGSVNKNNATVRRQAERYVKKLGDVFRAQDVEPGYILGSWEGDYMFHTKKGVRSPGYNPSQRKAFSDYLKERYDTVDNLNQKWGSSYASFSQIEPPADKFVQLPSGPSGLTYEFQRFMRINYLRWNAYVKQLHHKYIPGSPSYFPDPCYFITEGGTYLTYKENACDYMGFHFGPAMDEPFFTYFSTMNRTFGKVTGSHEFYPAMYTKSHLSNERLARRDLYKVFFMLFTRDVRATTFWFRHTVNPTGYVVGYGGGTFYLDYDQTVYRWSTTGYPVMFQRGRRIEKALVESQPEIPAVAIIDPSSSYYMMASLTKEHYSKWPAFEGLISFHNELLRPRNFAHDYIPEEMVLDGLADLSGYKLLMLPYAPYMSEAFSVKLRDWVKNGGTLVVDGPFALMNQYGKELPADTSLFKTLFPKYRKLDGGFYNYSLSGNAEPDKVGITERTFGRGRLVHLNSLLYNYTSDKSLKAGIERLLAGYDSLKTAASVSKDLKILVRDSKKDDSKYLCVSNANVEEPVTADVVLQGDYKQALDITIPGWFNVPLVSNGKTSTVKIHLAPGEWAMIKLK